MTDSPSEDTASNDVAALAERIADLVGADGWSADFGTAKVRVTSERWVEAHEALRDELPFFSWLSAVDWSAAPAVGDPAEDGTEERYELLSRLSDVTKGDAVTLSADLSKDDATIGSLIGVFGGADWHEREAHEMFGIHFEGHPNLVNLYLPDAFEGHPLRKSYPLLSREVKPWPGTVDVEDMPSTENPEADGPARVPNGDQ